LMPALRGAKIGKSRNTCVGRYDTFDGLISKEG
jgi:hypothetical protein